MPNLILTIRSKKRHRIEGKSVVINAVKRLGYVIDSGNLKAANWITVRGFQLSYGTLLTR